MRTGQVGQVGQLRAGKTYNAYMRGRACVPLISFSCPYLPYLPYFPFQPIGANGAAVSSGRSREADVYAKDFCPGLSNGNNRSIFVEGESRHA